MFKKINGHGHLLPEPQQIPQFMKDKEVFWVDDDRKFMRQGKWSRPITDPSFFLEEKLVWMEKNTIDHEVILNLSQLYCNGYPEALANDVIRFQNDFNAQVQQEHKEKFTTGFVVQPAYLDAALKEVERCVEELKMPLLCLPTHFLDGDGNWLSVAHEKVFPIFELVNKYSLADFADMELGRVGDVRPWFFGTKNGIKAMSSARWSIRFAINSGPAVSASTTA